MASSPSPTEIRLARFSELSQTASVCTAAFVEDKLFGDLIHPHRKEYPADPDLFWYRNFQVAWWDYRHRFVIATAPNPDTGRETVVGVSHWERRGEGGKKLELYPWDPRNLMHPLFRAWTSVTAMVWPNRAADPKNEDIMERSLPFIKGVWVGERAETWDLHTLAVDPAYHSQGIGRRLVKWGLDQAEAEGCCASVTTAPGKELFYHRCGFGEEAAGRGGMGEGNPLADVPGGMIFFRDVKKSGSTPA